ncbi:MAG: hypothetical protein ACYDD4_13720 [Acidimicrobiales bacterium]
MHAAAPGTDLIWWVSAPKENLCKNDSGQPEGSLAYCFLYEY